MLSPKEQTDIAFESFEKASPNASGRDEAHRRRRCWSQRHWATALIVAGSLTAVGGILYGTALPAYVNAAVEDRVVRCSDEEVSEEVYRDPFGDCDECSPYYVSLYMLNASNAEAYLTTNAKLRVHEMGPYVFRRRELKLDVSLSADASSVTYKTYTYHTFEADKSCANCSDADEIVSFDAGYFSVISATGGEFNLLASVAAQSFAAGQNASAVAAVVAEHGGQMMRWVNGLNSLDPVATKTVTKDDAVMRFLTTGPAAIADLDLSGFAYNGLFVKRTASQWALGYPSLLAGLVQGTNYVKTCEPNLNAACASCSGDGCLAMANLCSQCAKGAAVVARSNDTCAAIESIYAAEYGVDEAARFSATTCGLCASTGLCAAALPGIVESSGLDYSETAPDASTLNAYTKRTGCGDLTKIGTYVAYNGFTVAPVWAELGARRNPTLAELNAFSSYATCDSPVANVTCVNVSGTDGSALRPGGVTVNGMADQTTADAFDSYTGAAAISIPIASTKTMAEYNGVSLHRFAAHSDVFDYTNDSAGTGTGVPVNGLQQLSFVTGFLSYLSGPYFLNGDTSLLEAVHMTNNDGTVMSAATMYDSEGVLVESFFNAYGTFVDIESGTGQTVRARKRSQISYALASSTTIPNASMSDVLWPMLRTEVVLPTYWVQEAGEAKDSVLNTLKKTLSLVRTILPGLIVLLVAGVIEVGGGLFLWRHYRQTREKQRHGGVV